MQRTCFMVPMPDLNTITTAVSLTGANALSQTGSLYISTRLPILLTNSGHHQIRGGQSPSPGTRSLMKNSMTAPVSSSSSVLFRSNDMLTAAGANMYALVQLQNSIADTLGLPCGTYTHISLVPHIYYIRDMHDIEPFCGKGKFIHPVPEVCHACGGCERAKSI